LGIAFPELFCELFEVLYQQRIDFVVVGGYKTDFSDPLPATGDCDMWVGISSSNFEKANHAVTLFKADGRMANAHTFSMPNGRGIAFGLLDTKTRLELKIAIHSLANPSVGQERLPDRFKQKYTASFQSRRDKIPVSVVGRNEYLRLLGLNLEQERKLRMNRQAKDRGQDRGLQM
jgi:hypothetical protein